MKHQSHNPNSRIAIWFSDRLPLQPLWEFFSEKSVPRHKHSFWYYWGGLTLFFFIVQVVSGVLLALHYKPYPDHAYQSVVNIVNHVPHGWLVRSIHSWAANLMVGSLFVHMFSAFLMKAYRKPRELMWISGVLLLFLVLGFGFTGYLLPWDTTAYFATLIGTEVPQTLPLIGDWGVSLLKGEEEIGAETLVRMHTIHTVILPLTTLVLVSFHLLLNQVLGSSVPIGVEQKKPPIRFIPNFLYRDLIAWTLGGLALLTLATILPWGLGAKADPLASAPAGIRPEWYFLPLYQTLKIFPATVLGLSGEFVVNLLVVIAGGFWMAIPFLDKKSAAGERSRLFTGIGVVVLLYLVGTIALAYLQQQNE